MLGLKKLHHWLAPVALCGTLVLPMGVWAEELVDVVKAAAKAKDPSEKAFYQDLAEMHKKLAASSCVCWCQTTKM